MYTYDAGSTSPTLAGLAEHNGIRINDGTFKTSHLGGLVDTPPIRAQVTDLAGDHGGLDGLALYGPRDITLEGWLRTSVADDVFAATDHLRSVFTLRDGTLLPLAFRQRGWAQTRFVMARVAGPVTFTEPDVTRKKVGVRDFTVPLVAPDPLVYDWDTVKTADVPYSGSAVTLTNAGTVPAPFTVRFGGPFTGPVTLTCSTTGKVLTYVGNAIAGAFLDIETYPFTTVTSDVGQNYYRWMGEQTLFAVPPGSSSWHVSGATGTSGASHVTVTWRDAWV